MGILDKNYKITVDITSGNINSDEIIFASKDQNISNINVHFVKDGLPIDITGFTFIANIQKPDTLKTPFEIEVIDAENGIGIMDLPISLTMDIGVYNVEIEMTKDDEVSHTYTFSYTIRDTLCGDIDDSIIDDSNYNILINLVDDVRRLEDDITKSESIRASNEKQRISSETERRSSEEERKSNETERASLINGQIEVMDAKVAELEMRFNRLMASQQQDAEVVDARQGYDSLKQKLEQIEQSPMIIWEVVEG